ncbi:MAG: hypothetical protein B6D63_02690 [Candidatus Latescibacteria bacterium 4484_7]|nr:MAG: hypothetical protein B6D63_02690 [Candidatus Latescibacteria bacterium 4484_7]
MDNERLETKWKVALVGVVALAAFLRFFRLGHQSFWTDEILTYWAFVSEKGAPYWKKFLYDVHGPFYTCVLHFWSKVSMSEAWLRAPSALAGTAAAYFAFKWMNKFLNSKTALLGAVIFALSPIHIYYSQEMRFYSFLIFFTIVTLIIFEKFCEKPDKRTSILLGLAMLLTSLSHFSGVFIFVALFVVLLSRGFLRGEHLKGYIIVSLILIVGISPWIYREIYFLRGIDVIGFSVPTEVRFREELAITPMAYPYSLYVFATGYSFGPSLRDLHVMSALEIIRRYNINLILFSVTFVPLLIIGMIRSIKASRFLYFLSIIVVSIVMVTLIALLNIKVFNPRYLLCSLPAFIALVAMGIPQRGVVYKAGFLVLMVSIMLVSDYNYFFDERYSRDDVRSAARIIEKNEQKGDLVLVLTVGEVFDYYFKGAATYKYVSARSKSEEKLKKLLDRYMSDYRRIWYVRCRYWDNDPENRLLAYMSSHRHASSVWHMAGIDLFLMEPVSKAQDR